MRTDDSGAVLSAEAGRKIPPFSLAAMDALGNRTAPSANDGWQVNYVLLCYLGLWLKDVFVSSSPESLAYTSVHEAYWKSFPVRSMLEWLPNLRSRGPCAYSGENRADTPLPLMTAFSCSRCRCLPPCTTTA